MKTLLLAIVLLVPSLCLAEVDIYKSTYNTGINRLEQITEIETYLTKLSSMVNSMEAKLDANSVKLTTLENMLKSFKDTDLKKIQDQLGEQRAKPATPEMAELVKLKADVTAIRNEDIEKIRIQIQGLNSSMQSMQLLLRTQSR